MSVYHLGKYWDKFLEPTQISAVWNNPDFQALDTQINDHTSEIKEEILRLLGSSEVNMATFDFQHATLMGNSEGWKTIWLKYFGRIVQNSDILNIFLNSDLVYNASISILEPGAEIPLHVGQCSALVKYHIPIYIPEGDVGMLYNGKEYRWTSRTLFDDTAPHKVWNHTSERRIIILMDIFRTMSIPWNIINQRIGDLAWLDPEVRSRFQRIRSMVVDR